MMFNANEIVKVLVPNVINNGYDYRLVEPADVGDLVSVSVLNRVFIGLIIGAGDGNVLAEKIKPIIAAHGARLPKATVEWISRMSEWTMMARGAVFKLIAGAADFGKIKNKQFAVDDYFDTGNVVLTDGQKAAAAAINLDGFNVHLLDGITGSGKTQVYFDAAMQVYQAGKSVLLMMPEIALTAQFIHRFADRFGHPPIVWHSNLTPAKRRDIWHGVVSGKIKIVVGTRSALFLPWQDLGLIVVDEEHDSSYKQEEMGIYHARDMAVLMAKTAGMPVILASATPSFETLKNVQVGKYGVSKLTSRFGGATLPGVEVVDMRKRN
jgi:primosomal protein N' (replication factor Y)